MALEKFNLQSLVNMDDGRIKEAFEQAMRRCEEDCRDRPAVKEARKVSLVAVVSPVQGEGGDIDSCDVQFQIVDALPKRKSKVYNMRAAKNGLFYNELSHDNHVQMTVDEFGKGPRIAKGGK